MESLFSGIKKKLIYLKLHFENYDLLQNAPIFPHLLFSTPSKGHGFLSCDYRFDVTEKSTGKNKGTVLKS